MIACMCSCPRTAHQDGDGPCSCGCPLWRPVRLYSAEDEAHDVVHEAAVTALLAEHTLTKEVVRLEDGAAVWLTLPDLAGDPEDTAWAEAAEMPEGEA